MPNDRQSIHSPKLDAERINLALAISLPADLASVTVRFRTDPKRSRRSAAQCQLRLYTVFLNMQKPRSVTLAMSDTLTLSLLDSDNP